MAFAAEVRRGGTRLHQALPRCFYNTSRILHDIEVARLWVELHAVDECDGDDARYQRDCRRVVPAVRANVGRMGRCVARTEQVPLPVFRTRSSSEKASWVERVGVDRICVPVDMNERPELGRVIRAAHVWLWVEAAAVAQFVRN